VKKKVLLMVMACLVVTALGLAACGPAVTTMPPTTTPPTTIPPTTIPPTTKPPVEEPKYGGVFNYVRSTDILQFDEGYGSPWLCNTLHFTNEDLSQADWAKGPEGTNEISLNSYGFPGLTLSSPVLAESWEIPDAQTIVFHIRKGVHFHDKPPTSGRELTADDVAFSIKRVFQLPNAYLRMAETNPQSVEVRDKYTVLVKGPAGEMIEPLLDGIRIMPRDMVEKYGDMRDWRNSCGTGPFILDDYVSGASATYIRNPNYWDRDPFHPQNNLPYLDGIKCLIIPDASTRIAAIRTGKSDYYQSAWQDANSLIAAIPELKHIRYLTTAPNMIYMRLDTPGLPFRDLRVRQALAMAIDYRKMADEYYGGNAQILSYPIVPLAEFSYAYTPLDKLPQSIRELWEYHPDKSKQLLTEAGYPNGFKTEIVCYAAQVDLLSIIKAYWAAIGVDLKLDVREYGVYNSIQSAKSHKEMLYRYGGLANPARIHYARAGGPQNASIVVDEYIEESVRFLGANYFNETAKNQRIREVTLYTYDKCWVIQPPNPYTFVLWWPWVKGYNGETNVGYWNYDDFIKWIWLDQELKKKMTGR